MSLWGNGGLVTDKPAIAHHDSKHAPAVEGNVQGYYAMMEEGSKALLEAMMTAPRARK